MNADVFSKFRLNSSEREQAKRTHLGDSRPEDRLRLRARRAMTFRKQRDTTHDVEINKVPPLCDFQ